MTDLPPAGHDMSGGSVGMDPAHPRETDSTNKNLGQGSADMAAERDPLAFMPGLHRVLSVNANRLPLQGSLSYTPPTKLELKRLQRKIDIRIVPICAVLYLLCFLCRQNIGNAKTFKLMETLPINSSKYQLALTAFFLTYSTFDIPCNMAMRRLGPRIWLPLITLVSGIVTVCLGLVQNADELIGVRALLGMSECGLFPGVSMLITMWYIKKEAQFRNALFFCAASMAGAFAGVLAVGLSKMNGVGSYEGWRWILIIEGLLTAVVAAASFLIMQDSPSQAKFLTDREKHILRERLRNDEFGLTDDSGLTGDSKDNPVENNRDQDDEEYIRKELDACTKDFDHSAWEVFKMVFGDWHVYAHVLVFWGVSAPLYSISLCLPSILKELSTTITPITANLLTIPIYITACLISVTVAYASDRSGRRAPFLFAAFIVVIIGFVIALAHPLSRPSMAYAGVFIAGCGIYPAFPGMITWCANNFGGTDKVRAVGMAFHIGMGSFGGAMGANFYPARSAHTGFRMGHALNLGFAMLGSIAVAALWTSYRYVNKSRKEERKKKMEELNDLIRVERGAWKEAGDHEWERKEKEIRRRWEVQREMELVKLGNKSIWFVYTL